MILMNEKCFFFFLGEGSVRVPAAEGNGPTAAAADGAAGLHPAPLLREPGTLPHGGAALPHARRNGRHVAAGGPVGAGAHHPGCCCCCCCCCCIGFSSLIAFFGAREIAKFGGKLVVDDGASVPSAAESCARIEGRAHVGHAQYGPLGRVLPSGAFYLIIFVNYLI